MANKKHILWLLVSTMIISIGAGHGVAPIIMIQFWTILGSGSDIWLLPTALFSFGQITLFVAVFVTNQTLRLIFLFGGIVLIIVGISSLISIGLEGNNSAIPTYITTLPFAFLILKKVIKNVSNKTYE